MSTHPLHLLSHNTAPQVCVVVGGTMAGGIAVVTLRNMQSTVTKVGATEGFLHMQGLLQRHRKIENHAPNPNELGAINGCS